MTLNPRTAWITGGSRGIGRACAIELARRRTAVAVSARSQDELEDVAEQCRALGVKATAVPCDVTDPDAIAKAYEQVCDAIGTPHILVNNAGQARGIPFHKTTADNMEHYWKLNLMGTFHCTKAAVPAMLEAGWGRVVNIASVAGKVGAPYTTAYAVSKHAVLGLTRSLAQEYATSGVTFNAVCPGYVDTPMTDRNIELIHERTGISIEDARKRLESMSPQGRFMDADEIAGLVAHLCTEASRGINGQAITVDGGGVQW